MSEENGASQPEADLEEHGKGRIEELRAIVSKAAERDRDLLSVLRELGAAIVKELGCDDPDPVWGELRAGAGELQQGTHFILADKWLRGDLVVAVTPELTFPVGLAVREAKNHTHEATLNIERSQTMVIDPPDEKDRAAAHKKFFERVFANLESQVRSRVALPPE